MNKRGFTLVELITTFALTSVIVVLLINVVLVISNVYNKSSVKTELYINQSNLSNALNSKISKGNLESYEGCNDTEFCYIFNFVDGTNSKLTITDKQIKFDDFVYNLDKNTKVENPSLINEYVNLSDINNDDKFLVLNIPIKSKLYLDIDFGVNLVYSGNLQFKCNIISGNITTVGSEVKCGTEQFYVIPNDPTTHPTAVGDNVTLITKYNLDVGNIYDGTSFTPITNPTGIQISEAIGDDNEVNYYGVIAFAETKYWRSTIGDGTFVYDNRSLLYPHVENYKLYIKNLGLDVKEASLVSLSQMREIVTLRTEGLCSNFNYTDFWLGSVDGSGTVYSVRSNGAIGGFTYSIGFGGGVRPIITISKDSIS